MKKIINKIPEFLTSVFGIMAFISFCSGGIYAIYLMLFYRDLSNASVLIVIGVINLLLFALTIIARILLNN